MEADWIQASLEAFGDVAEAALMLPRLELVEREAEMATGLSGSFIALANEHESVQVGLAGTDDACRAVAAALMQMSADEAASLSPSEVADAVGEVVNIAAGGVKQRLLGALGAITLGIPMFIHGQVASTEKTETQVAAVRLGELALSIVVVRPRKGGRS